MPRCRRLGLGFCVVRQGDPFALLGFSLGMRKVLSNFGQLATARFLRTAIRLEQHDLLAPAAPPPVATVSGAPTAAAAPAAAGLVAGDVVRERTAGGGSCTWT